MTDAELDQIIFGADPTEGIVAVEVSADRVTVYRRTPQGVVAETDQLRPWLVAETQTDLRGAEWTPLAGEGYAHLAELSQWSHFLDAKQQLAAAGIDHFAYNDPVRHYLTLTGRALFKGIDFPDIHRLQLDIETTGLSAREPDSRILLIALSDNRGWQEILEGDEPELLRRLEEALHERDPDVVEGHNIFGFDLPFLAQRAERLDIALRLGRDDSALRFGRWRRCAIGGRSRPFVPAYIQGRHIIDTMLAVQRFDAQAAQLESYGLKQACEQLGLAEPDRVLIDRGEIAKRWRAEPDRVKMYAMQDVIETRRLAEYVTPIEFYLTQMTPEPYQSTAVSGVGEKINAMFVREYLRRRVALPQPQSAQSFPGGYVEVRRVGVIAPIVKVDVESLYPSIMLTDRIAPSSDTLGLFLPMLGELTSRRLEAKARAQSAAGLERVRWEGIQSSLKVLINSFYGCLGSGFLFNDFEAARRVTLRGRELVRHIADRIEATGGEVVEIDTDGVYFRPPENIQDEPAERAYVEELGAHLPKGIRLQHDGRYRAMLSLKIKNYVCVGYDGRKVFRGAAVRSRADEIFGREFLAEAVDLILAGDLDQLGRLYRDLLGQILAGELPAQKLARRERVTEKTFSSPAKRRSAAVAADIPVGEYISVYQRADGSLARVEDYAEDEDRAHYAEKLYRFAHRLRDAIGAPFEDLFPRPSARSAREATAGQASFGFD